MAGHLRHIGVVIIFIILAVNISPEVTLAQPDWENEQVIGINRQPAHATLMPFPDVESAARGVSTGLLILRSDLSISTANRMMLVNGTPSLCPPTGRCMVTVCRFMSVRDIRSRSVLLV